MNSIVVSNLTSILFSQIAQVYFGRAINNTVQRSSNIFMSGSGVLLIVLIAAISWAKWQKRT